MLGAGNWLLSDEGFGVHVIKELERRYRPRRDVTLYDAGTAGIALAPVIEEHTHLIVVDAVEAKGTAGSLLLFQGRRIWDRLSPSFRSSHQVGLLEVISICELRGWRPRAAAFLGVIPESTAPGVELSPAGEKALEGAVEQVERLLEEWNFPLEGVGRA